MLWQTRDRHRLYFTILFLLNAAAVAAQESFPRPIGFVNDFAGIVDEASKRRIEALAAEVEQKTGAEIVLVTLKSLDGGDIQDTANRLFQAWGIGKKGKDNGVLLLDAATERRVWVEVGYGLEAILPDGKVGGILDEFVIPYLRNGQFGEGFLSGISAIAEVIAENAGVTLDGTVKTSPGNRPQSDQGFGNLIGFFFLILLFLLFFGRRRSGGLWILPWLFLGGGGRGFGGGSFGGGFGGFGGGLSGGGGAGRGY
jgi:uncharacterized protein